MLKFLFIGDIVGRPGRELVVERLPRLRAERGVDFVIANAENAAAGSGITSAIAKELGWKLAEAAVGGGSDGNFTAGMGIPTLDGLGADGKGAHAAYEQIYFSSLLPRTYLCARLLETLD